jgi:hypothetical protein
MSNTHSIEQRKLIAPPNVQFFIHCNFAHPDLKEYVPALLEFFASYVYDA